MRSVSFHPSGDFVLAGQHVLIHQIYNFLSSTYLFCCSNTCTPFHICSLAQQTEDSEFQVLIHKLSVSPTLHTINLALIDNLIYPLFFPGWGGGEWMVSKSWVLRWI